MRLLRYPGWLLRCCYAVARVPGVVAKVLRTRGGCQGFALRLLGYPGWLLRCCYVVAKVPGVLARVLLSGC